MSRSRRGRRGRTIVVGALLLLGLLLVLIVSTGAYVAGGKSVTLELSQFTLQLLPYSGATGEFSPGDTVLSIGPAPQCSWHEYVVTDEIALDPFRLARYTCPE